MKWYKLANNEQDINISEYPVAVHEVNGKKICLTRFEGAWYAFAYKCPHASGIMADGYIDALGNVVCLVHRYKFSLKNGRNTTGEGYYLKTWPVERREDGLYVGMAESSWF